MKYVLIVLMSLFFLSGCMVPVKPRQPGGELASSVPMPTVSAPADTCHTLYTCALKIRARIADHVTQGPYDKKLLAKVNFQLNDKAEVIAVRLVQSSGEKQFDQAAIRAVRQSFPMADLLRLDKQTYQHFTNLNVMIKPE
ncbi:hypothetical protein VA7868_03664 [Vibrio aerogenes CECT 7868]|uniref:Gram-negative bacterial tonB protein n=1 Tax=Vibrio aerogenes CECT 7868 TaxID=1216006 RepID=A0A1M6AYC3_9VIBR|nr:TonB family protein [Vibrio aerogenes]SHI41462.1 hypothetical protein VA7868_03664 [Vibrio aerogenes CECT 7868]